MITTRFEPFSREIDVVLARHLSPQARSAALAAYARDKLAEVQAGYRARRGTVPDHETFVDGRQGANVDSVRPDGTIVFEFALLQGAIAEIGELLARHSPVRSGRYRRGHVLLADDREIAPEAAPINASEFVWLNVEPYARKIERGLSRRSPDGVYRMVADVAARRFANLARIRFSYRAAFVTSPRQERAARAPAIIISPR
jgi:hypothetical protein